MLVSRKRHDAAAALCAGAGVVLIATGLKPVPSVVSYLGVMAPLWGVLIMLSSLTAAVGAMLRTRNTEARRRRYWSVALERIGWPAIGGCALVFCIGVVAAFGVVDAALTLGWCGFAVFTCAAHWRDLQPPKGSRL